MIEVYHMPDEMFSVAAFANTQDLIDLAKINHGKYKLVAAVNVLNLEEAYYLTNSVQDHWSRNKEVEAVKRDERSTCVGDLLVVKEQHWLVSMFGFINVTPFTLLTPH